MKGLIKNKYTLLVTIFVLLALFNFFMFYFSFKVRPRNDWTHQTYVGKVIDKKEQIILVENKQKRIKSFIINPENQAEMGDFVFITTSKPMQPGQDENIEIEDLRILTDKK